MITFVSLFLGLVFGDRPVEVAVGPAVSVVELRLNGQSLGVIRDAPWTMRVDFGSEIAPQHLEAVAFDDQHKELGRVSQWLNLPQPRAVASVLLEPRQEGQPRIARLTWESSVGAEPKSVDVTLDGVPLAVPDPHRIELPPVDENAFHLLHAELRFEGRVVPRVDLIFGGSYADEVSTEITALSLLADAESSVKPSVAVAKKWFRKGGRTLQVLAVEKETAEIVVVMDRPFPYMVEPGRGAKKALKALALAADERVRFLSTVSEVSQGVATSFELFPISRPYGGGAGDFHHLLSAMMRPPQNRPPRPIAAVAVAGLSAYEGRHRRAVVLIPSSKPRDPERLTPDRVRRYLDRLGVSFFVWDPSSRSAPKLAAWGEIHTVSTLEQLGEAFAELVEHLQQQWIVWIDGRHLPQDVTLAPEALGFTLLAHEPSRP